PAGANVIGTIGLGSANSLPSLSGELNRVYRDSSGNIVEILNTPLALIKNGLPCLGGGCASAPFAGRSDSLMPYRENLTPHEVSHLLKKAALGANPAIYTVCVNQGLSACIAALQNYQEPFDVSAKALEVAEAEFYSEGIWNMNGGRNWWLTQLRYGNPLRGKASLILHDHIATSVDPYDGNGQTHHFVKEHLDLLWNNSLGNYRTFVKSWLFDKANSRELNFVDNHCGLTDEIGKPACNENGPREYFELQLTGTKDPFTGEAVYSENDVVNGFSHALSGFVDWTTSNPSYAGTSWDAGLWYGSTYGATEVFAGTPFHTYAIFDYDSFTDYVMQVHTQPARYLAYTYFSRLTGVAPTSQIVTKLAAQLRSTDYNIEALVLTIIKSQAMFSKESKRSCVGSPVENLMFFMRTLDLPLERAPANVYYWVRQYMSDTGHSLLAPPTVFGFGECFGHNGPSDGSTFLSAQRFLEGPYRNFREILDNIRYLIDSAGTTFTFGQLMPFPGASPSQLADSLALRLGCELSSPERNALAEYLATRKDYDIGGSNGATYPLDWDPETSTYYSNIVNSKIPGAIEILFAHPCGSMR
ncbi:MAG: DUF1800 family protein, partial [Bdellovibrionales bacterium]|nr:DUF1800 family protein [Bdellovibrionales bacterium]